MSTAGKSPISLSHNPIFSRSKKYAGPRKTLIGFAVAEDDSDGDGDKETAVTILSRNMGGKGGKDRTKLNAQLTTFNGLSKKAEEIAVKVAKESDPNIFDYDAAWDDMKSIDLYKKVIDEQDALKRKPKYMENLLVAAEVRKRDQLRAKEKLLQKEREEEGDEYAGKESFVTEAYKRQQEELTRMEEEERLLEGWLNV